MSAFADQAKKIFGAAGSAVRRGAECRVGFVSKYGFHLRGEAMTEPEALYQAHRSQLSDDPKPGNQSWVPSSFTDPFSPYKWEVR